MPAVEHYAEHYRAAVQRLVPDELVMSVGLFTRARRVGADGSRSPWHVDDVALGAGTAHLVAVHFRPAGMEIDALTIIATWARAHVSVGIEDAAVLRTLRILVQGADVIELSSNRQIGAFDRLNDALYRDLGVEHVV